MSALGMLKEHQADLSAQELCRKDGVSDSTFYKRRSRYGHGSVGCAQAEGPGDETRRLKKLLAESMLDAATLTCALVGLQAKTIAMLLV